jgi:hypothetical protein
VKEAGLSNKLMDGIFPDEHDENPNQTIKIKEMDDEDESEDENNDEDKPVSLKQLYKSLTRVTILTTIYFIKAYNFPILPGDCFTTLNYFRCPKS